jgi:hypothetical protein
MKSRLIYYVKNRLLDRYVLELSIHEVEKSSRYVDGVKYGLICIDTKTGAKVLFDKHHAKGPHIHIDDQELEYEYRNDDQLLKDFTALVLSHLGVEL